MTDTSVCTKCGEEKHIQEFHRQSNRASGRKASCAECCNASLRANRKAGQGTRQITDDHPYRVTSEEDTAHSADVLRLQQDFIYDRF